MPSSARPRRLPPALVTLATCAALAAAAPHAAGAQLLIDPNAPAGGATTTNLVPLLSDRDDDVVVRPFASAFTFYGRAHGSVAVATNGYLVVGGDQSWARSADRTLGELAADAGPTVAPLYDDLLLDASSSLLEHVAPGQYQAYTYANVRSYAPSASGAPGRSTFQVAFFTGATRVGAVDFLAGDVAFSYGPLAHTVAGRTATAGVARDAFTYTALPGTAAGEVADLSLVGATAGGAQRLVLLRPNQGGGYDVHDIRGQLTVPEPSSLALLAAGVGALWAARRRRRA